MTEYFVFEGEREESLLGGTDSRWLCGRNGGLFLAVNMCNACSKMNVSPNSSTPLRPQKP